MSDTKNTESSNKDESSVGDDPDDTVTELANKVSDGRKKHISVIDRSGERETHGEVYLGHTNDAFIVSPTSSFPVDATTRYPKAELLRVEIDQHHSMCFITTATAGHGPTLDALRRFREDALRPTRFGRTLIASYERVSPPIAQTLARHPNAVSTRAVRRLIVYCAYLACHRAACGSTLGRAGLSIVLVVMYIIGVMLAFASHITLRLDEQLC
jgi:hypothetical protein